MNITSVYDSRCKKYETTRRKIYKDSNGKYKEKLEIKNCEKRTLFGAPPFKANSKWNLEDLSDFDDDEQLSESKNRLMKGTSKLTDKATRDKTKQHFDQQKQNSGSEQTESEFNVALQNIISKLKESRNNVSGQNMQGVRKIYEKTQGLSKPRTDADAAF